MIFSVSVLDLLLIIFAISTHSLLSSQRVLSEIDKYSRKCNFRSCLQRTPTSRNPALRGCDGARKDGPRCSADEDGAMAARNGCRTSKVNQFRLCSNAGSRGPQNTQSLVADTVARKTEGNMNPHMAT